jgi:ABC-type Fe3+-hydroxamate transport system substrate-binding protein
VTILDLRGRALALDAPPRRVVSLVPSVTETLFDLGAGETVVGVTDFCIFPASGLEQVTRVGGTKNPVVEKIRSLRPDLVYMNFEENLERHAREIENFAPIHVSEPKSVGDVERLVRDLGNIHGRQGKAREWIDALDREVTALSSQRPFTFACPIWKNPWMWCGGDTYVSNLVASAGGVNVLADRSRYPSLGLEQIEALAPSVIFLPDEPFVFTGDDRKELAARMPAAEFIGPFPGHLFTWHGTRTVAGLRFLGETLSRRRSLEARNHVSF